MLSRIHTSFGLSLLAAACVFTGCIIESGRGSSSSDSTASTGDSTTTTSGSGGSSSSSTTGGGGDGGGGGGTPSCVGIDGTGLDEKSCDNMNITPASAGGPATDQCDGMGGLGGMESPPGYPACQHGFEVFNPGPAEAFQKCLAMISLNDMCELTTVQKCSDSMFQSTCEVPEIRTKCTDLQTVCKNANPPQDLDADGCAFNLSPFNSKALEAYETCFNNADPMLTCQEAHDKCFVEQL